MRQTLFYIPSSVAGFPLFGFGILFWLIVAFTVVAMLINRIRKGTSSDFWNWFSTGVAAAAVVAFILPGVAEREGFPVRGYGVFLMLAIVAAALMIVVRGRRRLHLSADTLLVAATVSVVFGILGARLFYVCEYWNEVEADTPGRTLINIVNVTRGGLVVYGSIIGGMVALVLYLLWKKLPVLAILDLFAPALMLGLAFGRLGCLMNGCCYGGVCEHGPAICFPPGSPAHVRQMELGLTSVGGLWLEPDVVASTDRTLFRIKAARTTVCSETEGHGIRIRTAEPGSDAARSGLPDNTRLMGIAWCPDSFATGEIPREKAMQLVQFPVDHSGDLIQVVTSIPDEHTRLLVAVSDSPDGPLRYFAFVPDRSHVLPVYPTQLYSSVMALVICLILLGLARVTRRDGQVFAAMLILYPINRFLLELLRTDEGSFWGTGLTVAQCISLVGLLAGILLLVSIHFSGPVREHNGEQNVANE